MSRTFEHKQAYKDKLELAFAHLRNGDAETAGHKLRELFETIHNDAYDKGFEEGYQRCFTDQNLDFWGMLND